MKTIIIISDITRRAGTERAVSNLANIISSDGSDVYIISINSTIGLCAYELNGSVHVLHLGMNLSTKKFLGKLKSYFLIKKEIISVCKEKKVNIVIGTYSVINFILAFLPKNIRKIGCEHFNYESASFLQRILRRMFYKKLSNVVVLTEKDEKKYKFLKNISVIPNSLSFDTKQYSACEKKEIISCGRLTKQKGFDMLIDVAFLVQKKAPDWHFSIYGEGEDYNELKNKIRKLNLEEYVSIKPYSTNIINCYIDSSIYISTSRWEGLPMVLIEAQSCGVPIVAFDCPCGPSDVVIDNETGFLVELGDTVTMADKILDLIMDQNKRIIFGKKSVVASKRYSTEVISECWKKILGDN